MATEKTEGALALLAYRRGEESELALLGALMEVEFESAMLNFVEGWSKAHTKKG